jgi:hypothetical protein
VAYYLSVQPYFYSYLLVVQHESVTAAGHITNTFSFTSTATAIATSFLIKYTKYYKPYVVFGSCIYIVGLGLMIRYRNVRASVGQIVGTQIAVGIGGGMLNIPAQLGVQAGTDHQHVAIATAVFLTCVELGGAVGSAISGAIWGKNIPTKLSEYLPVGSKQDAQAIYNSIGNALKYVVGTPERLAIERAYQETMRILLIIAICVAIPLIPLSLLMKNYKLDTLEQNVKGWVIGGQVEGGNEDEVVKGDGTETKRLGKWSQWSLMLKTVVP